MGFFDRIGRQVQDSGNNVMNKTKEFADIQKCNTQIGECKSEIKALYYEIGEKYCQLHKDDPEEALSEKVISVNTLTKKIDELNHEIQRLRGFKDCPFCGKEIPVNTEFCSGCGKRVASEDVKQCPGCHKLVKKNMRFCTYCGHDFGSTQAPVEEKKCKVCGSILAPGAMFCSGCGTRAEEEKPVVKEEPVEMPKVKICSGCGSEVPSNFAFCIKCGTRVDAMPAEPDISNPVEDEVLTEVILEEPKEEVAPPFMGSVEPPFEEPVAPPFEEPVMPPFPEPVAPPFDEPVAPPFEEPVAPPSNDRNCKNCGKTIPEHFLFCTYCGYKYEEDSAPTPVVPTQKAIFCTVCGFEVEPDEIFCSECGNRLK